MKKLLAVTALATTVASAAVAEPKQSSPLKAYVGAEIGFNVNSIADDLPFNETFEENSENGSIVAGLRSGHFGVELGFNQTTDADKNSTVAGIGAVSTEASSKTFSIDFLGYYPIGSYGTDIFGGLGWAYIDYDIEIVEPGIRTTLSDDGDAVRLTAGIEQMLHEHLSVRALYRYSDYGSGDIYDHRSDFNLGVQVYF